jgi:lipopolysaccharide assembly protein A
MQILLILALLIAIVAVIFALQNVAGVTVTFLIWSIHSSLALVLLVTLAAGVIIGLLTSLPASVRNKWSSSGQKKKLTALEAERDTYRQKTLETELDVKNLEEQLASLSAELDKYQTEAGAQTPSDTPPQ